METKVKVCVGYRQRQQFRIPSQQREELNSYVNSPANTDFLSTWPRSYYFSNPYTVNYILNSFVVLQTELTAEDKRKAHQQELREQLHEEAKRRLLEAQGKTPEKKYAVSWFVLTQIIPIIKVALNLKDWCHAFAS